MMELVEWNKDTKEHTVKMSSEDFYKLVDILSGLTQEFNLLDKTLMGVTKEDIQYFDLKFDEMVKKNLQDRGLKVYD